MIQAWFSDVNTAAMIGAVSGIVGLVVGIVSGILNFRYTRRQFEAAHVPRLEMSPLLFSPGFLRSDGHWEDRCDFCVRLLNLSGEAAAVDIQLHAAARLHPRRWLTLRRTKWCIPPLLLPKLFPREYGRTSQVNFGEGISRHFPELMSAMHDEVSKRHYYSVESESLGLKLTLWAVYTPGVFGTKKVRTRPEVSYVWPHNEGTSVEWRITTSGKRPPNVRESV